MSVPNPDDSIRVEPIDAEEIFSEVTLSSDHLYYWQVTCELPSGNTVKVNGIAASSRTACLLTRDHIVKTWAQDKDLINVIGVRRVGVVEFGV